MLDLRRKAIATTFHILALCAYDVIAVIYVNHDI